MADKENDRQIGETVIGPETRVSGELRGDEDVVVKGRIDGRVNLTSTFTVEESAIVQADVEARVVLISGVVVGNVTAVEILRLTDKARVVGDLSAPRVIIEGGAAFRGRLEMGEIAAGAPASVRTTARKPTETAAKAPPRLAPPSRVTPAGAGPARVAPAAPPRPPVAAPATAARAPVPPTLPRPGAAAAGGIASTSGPGAGPSWAKKKLQRRR